VASSTNEQLANTFLPFTLGQVASSTNEQLAITSYFHHMPSGKFYKRTTCNYLLSLFCVKWQVLQTKSLQLPFILILFQVASSTNEQLANLFLFYVEWQVLQTNICATLPRVFF